MANATPGSRFAQAALARVLIGCRLDSSIGLQFFSQVLARAGQTRFYKGHADVGVDGAKRIVGDVNLSERGCAKERGFSHVWFADETDAHSSTP